MDKRYAPHQLVAAKGLSLIPSVITKTPESAEQGAMQFAAEYSDDPPVDQNMSFFKKELLRWHSAALSVSEPATNISEALKLARSSKSPCIERLLMLAAVLPVTSKVA